MIVRELYGDDRSVSGFNVSDDLSVTLDKGEKTIAERLDLEEKAWSYLEKTGLTGGIL